MSQRQPFPSQHGSTRRFFLNLFCSCKCPGIHDTFIFWRWKTCWVWSCHLNTWMMMHSTNVYCHPLQLVHLRCLLHGFSSWVHRKAQSLDRCLDSALNCMQSRPRVGWAAVIRQGGVLSWNKLSGYCNSIHWKKHLVASCCSEISLNGMLFVFPTFTHIISFWGYTSNRTSL